MSDCCTSSGHSHRMLGAYQPVPLCLAKTRELGLLEKTPHAVFLCRCLDQRVHWLLARA